MKDGYYHGLDDREDLRRYPQTVAETEAMFASHPDNTDAPDPNPARPGSTESVDDATVESELAELEDELDG